jgi:hypothetical protein
MQIENSLCDYDAVESINLEMRGLLDNLVQQKYFKFYKVTNPPSTPNESFNCALAVVSIDLLHTPTSN